MASALRTALFALLLTSALLLAAASAAANEFATSEEDFRIAWDNLNFVAGGTTTTCDVTLSGSFHEVILEKVPNALIGHITNASVEGCNTGASATVLTADLPWHVRYLSFSGSLPEISSVTLAITGASLQFDPDGLPACLFRTEASEPFRSTVDVEGGGYITGFTADPSVSIDLENVEFLCAIGGDGEFGGTGRVTDSDGDLLEIGLEEVDGDGPRSGVLTPTPERVDIAREAASGTVTLRNTGGFPVTIDRLEDEGAAEFDVSGCGAGRTIVGSGSCVYTVQVDRRPLEAGRITVEYDDGLGNARRVSIAVDIVGDDIEAILVADPTSVTIDALEQNDILEIANEGGGSAATLDRIAATTTDTGSPEFTVTTTGCGARLPDAEACHFLISVNSRPETSGSITVEYDDGLGSNRRLVIEVDIVSPDPAELLSTPGEVSIERLESNDSFVIRNLSPDTAALINRVTLTSDDRERPEFSVTGLGCPEIYLAGASCTYIISVNSRPEADGRYEIEYDDGAGRDRTVTTTIDIAS